MEKIKLQGNAEIIRKKLVEYFSPYLLTYDGDKISEIAVEIADELKSPDMGELKKEELKKHLELQKQYENESGEKWWTNPVCHGEIGFASWEYQKWLEQKIIDGENAKVVSSSPQGGTTK